MKSQISGQTEEVDNSPTASRIYKCKDCDKEFPNPLKLASHRFLRHKTSVKLEKGLKIEKDDKGMYTCINCNTFQDSNHSVLKKHYLMCVGKLAKQRLAYYTVKKIDLSYSFVKKENSDLIMTQELTKLGLLFHSKWNLFICKNKNCNVVSNNLPVQHLLTHGVVVDAEDVIQVKKLVTTEDVIGKKGESPWKTYLDTDGEKEPLEGIPIINGFKCQYCSFVCSTKSTIEVHSYTIHRTGRKDRMIENCPVQKYEGIRSKIFVVKGTPTDGGEEKNEEEKVDISEVDFEERKKKLMEMIGGGRAPKAPRISKDKDQVPKAARVSKEKGVKSSKPRKTPKKGFTFEQEKGVVVPIDLHCGYRKSDSDLTTDADLTKFGLIVNTKEHVWICKRRGCNFVITGLNQVGHALNHGQGNLTLLSRKELLHKATSFFKTESHFEEKLESRTAVLEPVEGLPILNGIKCKLCNYCFASIAAATNHVSVFHREEDPEKLLHDCFYQQFFGKASFCYEVVEYGWDLEDVIPEGIDLEEQIVVNDPTQSEVVLTALTDKMVTPKRSATQSSEGWPKLDWTPIHMIESSLPRSRTSSSVSESVDEPNANSKLNDSIIRIRLEKNGMDETIPMMILDGSAPEDPSDRVKMGMSHDIDFQFESC